jgi:antimicrobial peptide system SdpB family protein
MLDKIQKLITNDYWTINLGIARSFLAFGTFLTLAFNPVETLFLTDRSSLVVNSALNLFYLFNDFQISILLACGILLLVMSGMYPRITCLLHAWVAASFSTASIAIEGGDQITTIICVLLLPILLLDKRKNHYLKDSHTHSFYSYCLSFTFYLLISIQASFLYFQASIGKLKCDVWANGTAAYYWFNDSVFGMNNTLLSILSNSLKSSIFITLLTWGTIALELFLALTIFTSNKRVRNIALISGVFLHVAIAISFGLISFLFAMLGTLILYLRPENLSPFKNSLKKIVWNIK